MSVQESDRIKVFAHNYQQEAINMAALAENYPVITLDTEYTSIVAEGAYRHTEYNEYYVTKNNVIEGSMIQLAITFRGPKNEIPEGISTWELNLLFDEGENPLPAYLVRKLKHVPRNRLKHDGVRPVELGYCLTDAGIFYNDHNTFIFFHGEYDIIYLIKMMLGKVPGRRHTAVETLNQLFVKRIIDVKFKRMLTDPHTFMFRSLETKAFESSAAWLVCRVMAEPTLLSDS